ncbi:hypothetical protein D9619_009829 [Psilocybe cf. subviscida]|uniref:UDP-glucose/GDP-mannose dehydrogenase dimerisation domain-containing protein n=1 Tax=Psilocybe cf. subviscida TaxID=2480587 RepID=A0A8H5BLF0_9AGAR|nr:hypothetical protein D9619_009829 [Psilocybe cf. subviscida]
MSVVTFKRVGAVPASLRRLLMRYHIKVAANPMFAQHISSVNALSAICEATCAKIDKLAYTIRYDSLIGPKFLEASLDFAGLCFPEGIRRNLVCLRESLYPPRLPPTGTRSSTTLE